MRTLTERDLTVLTAAQTHAAIFGRDDLAILEVTGTDREKYLQAMLTQDVKDLAENAVTQSCLCDAQGKILAIFTLLKEAERFWLLTDAFNAEFLRNHLDRYTIMNACELELQPDLALVTLVGPQVPAIAQALNAQPAGALVTHAQVHGIAVRTWQTRTGAHQALPEQWFLLPRGAEAELVAAFTDVGATIGCHAAQDVLRIQAGVPLLRGDIEEGSLPLEVGLRETVNYRKGCYVGQEAIAMMTYRGQLRRHLCWVTVETGMPQPGWQLRTEDGKRAGKMGTAARWAENRTLGLATIARKVYVPGGVLLAQDEATGAEARLRVVTTTKPDVFPA